MKSKYLSGVFVLFGLALAFNHPAGAAPAQVLHDHVPAAVKSLQPEGRLPATNQLNLAIALPLRDSAGLTNLLRQIYDPASPNYHHYLTPEQFAERFGPLESDYQVVVAFADANGLRVTARHVNRVLLDVSGSVANVERAFHVTMRTYQHPVENRTFYAPDAEPSLDLTVPILHISGLNDYSLPRPRLKSLELVNGHNAAPNAGSGPSGSFMGNDFRAAYAPGVTLDGTGQIVGLLQFDGYTASDITHYEGAAGLPNVPLQNVLIDGATGNPSHSGGEVEVSLDIEMAISMATNLSKVIIYEAPDASPFVDLLSRMANDNLAKQLSCSWYVPDGPAEPAADVIFQQMAAQGQSFFGASGDYDAFTGLIDFPGDTPYITLVGGTTLTTTGPGGSYGSETVWNWGIEYGRDGIGSGGGVSTQYGIPDWQTNISMAANQGSTTMRNTPDVALTADHIYVRADGYDYIEAGTSCSAPLWAGFMALVNQEAVAAGQPPVGFLNPLLDTIGSGASYTSAFHDIMAGNNTWGGSPTRFYAVTGYDLCTGWGTPAGQRLIDALANPEALIITPPTGFTSTGGFGGPFTVTSLDLVLTNAGTNSLSWTLANTSAWLNVSSSGGTLAPGGAAATVTVSLNTAASNLVAGTYNATVWFTNLNDNAGQSRLFTLNVISPPTITTQPADQAVLEGATASFTVAAAGGLPLAYQWQDNGTNLADGGNILGSTTTNLVISNVSSNNIGAYTVTVTNVAGSTISSNALLTIVPSAPIIVLQPSNLTAIVGSTAAFTVTAIGTTPFSYQWSFGGTNLQDATNATLTLANIQLEQAGTYAVVVTNLYGSATSSNATLNVNAVPVITSFNPQSGAVGTVVNITGLNFDPNPANNTVYFGGVQAVVNAASATNLVVIVPPGATYKPITETVGGLTAYSPMPFLPTFPSGGILTNSSLGPQISLPGLSYMGNLIFADIDGDGKPDLVVMSGYGPTVSIYRNISTNGTLSAGSFAPRVDLALGNNTSGITCFLTVADLNGDGKLDIVVSISNSGQTNGTVSVIQNFCTPGNIASNLFGAPVNFLTAAGPGRSVAVRDLDGDGKPEIVTANFDSSTISVLRNTGTTGVITTNSFAPAIHFAAGAGTSSVGLADLDGDGKPDVVTVNENSTSAAVSVFRNISTPGNIAFAPRVDFSGPTYCYELAIGDMDGDGKLDVVFVSFAVGQSASVYRNMSTPGSIVFAPRIDFGLGGWGNAVTVGDLDGDGKPDVAAVTQSSSELSLFRNISTPGLFTNSSLAARLDFASGSNPYGVAIGDLDGDGRPDIAFANNYGNSISLYQNIIPFAGPPVITSQPTDQTAVVGGVATFIVTAGGTPPLAYQWSFNGTNILGATNTSLTLVNAQHTNAGPYSVTVTNLYGSTNSANALLTVNSPSSCDPAPSGIVAWWPGEGNANDIIGTNNGSVVGSIAYTNGEVGQAFSLNGSSGYVSIPDSPALDSFTNSITIECWIKGNLLTANPSWEWIVTKGNTAWRLMGTSGAKTISFTTSGTTGAPDLPSTRVVNDGQWHHIACVYDGAHMFIYVDGTLDASEPATGLINVNSYPVDVGQIEGASGDIFNGLIDEVSLYHRALSASEIAAIYNAGVQGKCAPPQSPMIITQPANQTVVVSNSATFSVTATGTQPLFYQWNFNGTNILGATNTSLTLVNVQPTDAGPYSVTVTNLYGSTNSITATLTVNPPPSCDPAPSGLVAWWPAEGNANDIVGTNNGVIQGGLSFTNGEVGQAFWFNTTTAAVKVAASPSLNVGAGGGFTIECWVNPSDLSTADPIVEWNNGSGSIGVVFYLNISFSGNLYANIVDSGGAGGTEVYTGSGVMTSGEFQHVAVTYDKTSGLATLYRNGAVVAQRTVGSLTPQTSYDLYLGRRPPTSGAVEFSGLLDEVSVYNRALSSNEIAAIYNAGSGGKCLPTSTPPLITLQPTNQTAFVGGAATFSVTATGTPPLFYQWNFNGTNIVAATNATLTLANVQLTNAGNYAVLVANSYGSIMSSNAVLTVTSPATNVPVITAFSPASGYVGAVVNVSGLNFDPNPGNNTVYFGAVQAMVSAASATNLVVAVPAGATYAPITETVGGLTAYSPMSFLPTFPGGGILTNSSLGPQISLPSLSGIGPMVFADVDGDGKPDIVTFSGYGPVVSIYRNISTNGTLNAGSFAPRVDLPLGNNMSGVTGWLTLADLDGDGKLDIVVCNEISGPTNGTVSILQNFCTPGNITTNTFGAPVNFMTAIGSSGVAVRDLDGDGKPDIVTANYDSSTISVLRNTGTMGVITTNSFAAAVHFTGASGTRNLAIADLDGDGKPDVVTVDEVSGSTGAVSVFRNVSTPGNIAFASRVDFPGPTYGYNLAIGDMDGDGKLDVVFISFAVGQSASVYRNMSMPGSIAFAPRIDFGLGGWGNAVAVGDLDGDGKPDVAAVTQSSSKLSLFRNISIPGLFTNSSLAARLDFASGSNPYGVTIGDLDGDGRPDIAFANNYGNTFSIYQNVIGARPFIVLQPASQTNLAGTTATFTIVGSGSTPLTYQWKMNGTNIIGATGTNFTIVSVQATNAGIYSVAITNAYGSVISSNAVLVVNPLFHFVWNQIPSPRFATAPFAVIVQAQNPTNGLAVDFTNIVILLSTNGVPVAPPVSGNFIQGVWTGAVTINQTFTNLVLEAMDSYGESGLANPINVVSLPALATASSAGSLYIFWPVNPSGFALETTPGLSPANWVPVAAPPLQFGGQNFQPIQMSETNAFYRLRFTGQ